MAEKYKIKNPRTAILAGLVNVGGHLIWGWQRLRRVNLAETEPRRILVLQLDEIGDVLLSTPALACLRQAFPQAQIDVVVRPGGQAVLRETPDIDKLIPVDVPRLSANSGGFSQDLAIARKAAAAIKKVAGHPYDLGIDLRADLRTIYILYRLNIPVRVSQAIRSGGFWLTNIAPYVGLEHEAKRKLGIVKFVRPCPGNEKHKLRFHLTTKDEKRAGLILQENGITRDEPYAVMHIFAGWQPKEWPQERFAELAKYLLEKYQLRTVIIGTEKESARIDNSDLNREGVINLAGQTSLAETAAIIKKARVFIGNDSGPMHIAAAVQAPVVALFGQNTPKRYGPWQTESKVLYHQVECSPCPQTDCKRQPSCLELITVDEVKSAVDQLLNA